MANQQCWQEPQEALCEGVPAPSGWANAYTSPGVLSMCLDKATASAFHVSDLQQSQQP